MEPEEYRGKIRAMKVGESIVPIDGFRVKCIRRNDFVIFQDNNKTRSRWGSTEEIISDLDTCFLIGTLPKQDMPSW